MSIEDTDQHNALCMAASEGYPAVMAFLIEQEVAKGTRTVAEILDTPCGGHLPLIHHAVRASQIDVVRFLVREMGVDLLHFPELSVNGTIHSQDAGVRELLPHHYAALLGHLPLLGWFLTEGGVSVNVVGIDGQNALHRVCWNNFRGLDKDKLLATLRYLVEECGADICVYDPGSMTPFNYAVASEENERLAEYLAPKIRDAFMVSLREEYALVGEGARLFSWT